MLTMWFVVTMHEGACETGSQISRDLTYCSHKPECIVTTNLDRSILIRIIETISPEGTFCDTVQVPSSVDDMELN